MRFPIYGTDAKLLLGERVETVDEQHHVYSFGVQYEDEGIDSLDIGFAAHTLNNAFADLEAKKEAKKAKKARKASKKADKKRRKLEQTIQLEAEEPTVEATDMEAPVEEEAIVA